MKKSILLGAVLCSLCIGYTVNAENIGEQINSKGYITINKGDEKVVFDAKDLTTINKLIVEGKGKIATRINNIDTTQTLSSYNSFDELTEGIDAVYEKGKQASTKGMVFSSSPVDMKLYTNDWANLTNSDFVVGCSAVSAGASSGGNGENNGSALNLNGSPSFSYNASTGILTFYGVSKSDSYQVSAWNNSVSLNFNANAFAVWLGTINGE